MYGVFFQQKSDYKRAKSADQVLDAFLPHPTFLFADYFKPVLIYSIFYNLFVIVWQLHEFLNYRKMATLASVKAT